MTKLSGEVTVLVTVVCEMEDTQADGLNEMGLFAGWSSGTRLAIGECWRVDR